MFGPFPLGVSCWLPSVLPLSQMEAEGVKPQRPRHVALSVLYWPKACSEVSIFSISYLANATGIPTALKFIDIKRCDDQFSTPPPISGDGTDGLAQLRLTHTLRRPHAWVS